MASPMMIFESVPALARTSIGRTSYGTPKAAPKAPLQKTFAESKAPMSKKAYLDKGGIYGGANAGATTKPVSGQWKDLNNDPEKDET